MLKRLRVIVCLGAFAWEGVLRVLRFLDLALDRKPSFCHGAEVAIGSYSLIGSYHPSQQNTFTGRLTESMLNAVLRRARKLAVMP
jgi:uracil-DNA glycosylase